MDFDDSMEQADDNPQQMNLSINKQQDHQLIEDRHNKEQRDDNLEQKQQHQRQINKEEQHPTQGKFKTQQPPFIVTNTKINLLTGNRKNSKATYSKI
ncbi:uncharacterized protein LOC122510113 isoform X3 [Leptopilina heterotoma]|uniref:uncharacterized protein LOC122510113 isoform X3 n=1 Tax=Leptopilina heterotoma TaxID=63436 RepID=UPI001CA8B505|nr:uncharacterized protein LOC122510113 isoform X3 [Leptopilina heterotoma]